MISNITMIVYNSLLQNFILKLHASIILPFAVLFIFIPTISNSSVLTEDAVWSGKIEITEDLLIPNGITLTIEAGSTIIISPADSTKTDPEYLSQLTEITVRGHLEVEGEPDKPVTFRLSSGNENKQWAGIIIDEGNAWLRAVKIQDAEVAINILRGWTKLKESIISGNRYGIVAQGENTGIKIEKSTISKNDYGISILNNAKYINQQSTISENNKKDTFVHIASLKTSVPTLNKSSDKEQKPITRVYKNESLLGTTIWDGRIVVNGVVRVPPDSRLIIYPGTIIEFSKRDTNKDNIGENGLLLQGIIIAKGTTDKPIYFRSGETVRNIGDWDSINILGSDGTQNIIENCFIENAYRGMHFHFSNVAVNKTVLRNNYRGIQFQESIVNLTNNTFIDNKSGIQARDSDVTFQHNKLINNYTGANFFRLNLQALNNSFSNHSGDGIRIREGRPTLINNSVTSNRFGIRVADVVYGSFNNNIVNGNNETGISLRNNDNFEIAGNVIQYNGINGISTQDSRGIISNNLISDNQERGIGIDSFTGIIRENNFANNGLFAIELEGKEDVSAPNNWWGYRDANSAVFDRFDDNIRGKVWIDPVNPNALPFQWSKNIIDTDIAWHGSLGVSGTLTINERTTLNIAPGTTVLLAKKAELDIHGSINAIGTPTDRILFTLSDETKPTSPETESGWGEVRLERSKGSEFKYCDFQYATWGIHSHFSSLNITYCTFTNSYGGIRFRSGPLNVNRSSFERNMIGMRSFVGKGTITENNFSNNEIAIFVRAGGDGLQINRNNIGENLRYSIRLGDFNKEDVDARENWWGTDTPSEIIFDDNDEPEIGRVLIDPLLKQPLDLGNYSIN